MPGAAKTRELHRLAALSVPAILTQVGTQLLGLVDTVMVGRLGPDALSAASLGHLWVMGTAILALGIVFGMDPIVTQAHGRRDGEALGLVLQRGCILSLAVCVPIGALWWWTEPCLRLFGQKPELCQAASGYVRAQLPSLPAFMLFNALRQYLQGRGIVRPAVVVVILANGVNAALNACLIHGLLGFPALGVLGAGLATSFTRIFLFAALLWIVLRWRLHAGAWTPWSRRAFSRPELVELLGHGIPVGLQYALEGWAFQAGTLLAGWIGTVELAAHTAVLNLASLSFMLPLGVSLGAVTRVGNLLGEGRRHRAQLAAYLSLALGAGVMTASAILFVLLREILPALYTEDASTIAAAARILPIAGAFQLADGVQVVGGGILRGMGRTRPAAVFNVVAYYVLALPLGWYLAFSWDLGLQGLWWGLAFGLGVVAALLVHWIRKHGPGTRRVTPRRQ